MVHGAMIRQLDNLDSGDMAPNEPTRKACEAALKNLAAVEIAWTNLNQKELAAFNAVLTKYKQKPIAAMFAMPGTN